MMKGWVIVVGLVMVGGALVQAQEGEDEKPTEVTVTADEVTVTVTVAPAPTPSPSEPSRFSAVLGVGTVWRFDDAVDFQVSDNYLFVENDSRWRPSLSPGLMYSLGRSWSFLLTPNFEARTNYVFDGVMLGLATGGKGFHFGFGLALRLGEELSPGFRKGVVKAIADHAEELAPFQGVCLDSECKSSLDVDKALDGFPLEVDGERVFVGNPIIRSVNKSLFVGGVRAV